MALGPAYAKVNLALEVTGRRPDGYHDLRTVFLTVDWHDLVGVELTTAVDGRARVRVDVGGPTAAPDMAGEDALVARAGARLLAAAPSIHDGLRIIVHKRLAAAAGLGGGSADAAAVLRLGAAELRRKGVELATSALFDIAAELGSDVSAQLAGGASLGLGRGEILAPLPVPELHLAVAVAGASSTGAVYAAIIDGERRGDGRALRLAAALRAARRPADDDCGSALEPAACRVAPELGDRLARLRALTPDRAWHLTGSGGGAFALAAGRADARALAAAAQTAGFPARACRSVPAPLLEAPR